jgi:hypothetical protein
MRLSTRWIRPTVPLPRRAACSTTRTLRDLKLIADQEDRPIWLPGIATREPDTILGYQYVINQDMAHRRAPLAKPLLFGDFSASSWCATSVGSPCSGWWSGTLITTRSASSPSCARTRVG